MKKMMPEIQGLISTEGSKPTILPLEDFVSGLAIGTGPVTSLKKFFLTGDYALKYPNQDNSGKVTSFQEFFLAAEYALRYPNKESSKWLQEFRETLREFGKQDIKIIFDDVVKYGKTPNLDKLCSSNNENPGHYKLSSGQMSHLIIPESTSVTARGLSLGEALNKAPNKKQWLNLFRTLTGTNYSSSRIERILAFAMGTEEPRNLRIITKKESERNTPRQEHNLVLSAHTYQHNFYCEIDFTKTANTPGVAYATKYVEIPNKLSNKISDAVYELKQTGITFANKLQI
jgi:hypothetical protein